jgi:hypothetical protein
VVVPVGRPAACLDERLLLVGVVHSVAEEALELVPHGRAFVVLLADGGAINRWR